MMAVISASISENAGKAHSKPGRSFPTLGTDHEKCMRAALDRRLNMIASRPFCMNPWYGMAGIPMMSKRLFP
jgi:hypothetical protein